MSLHLYQVQYTDPELQHLGSKHVYARNQAQAEWIVSNSPYNEY